MIRAIAILLLIAAPAAAQDGPHVELGNTPIWAARAALADAKGLPADIASRSRYVWLRGGTQNERATLSYVVNASLSRVNIGITPGSSAGIVPFAGGRLARLDFGVLATEAGHLANLTATWEKLGAQDTDFTATVTERRRVSVKPYRASNGKTYDFKFETITARGAAVHVAAEIAELGTLLGNTQLPIIDGRKLQQFALTTQNGGQYYAFRGLSPGIKFDDYLVSRGLSRVRADQLESLEKAVVLNSRVTGKQRMIVIMQGQGVRPTSGGALGLFTIDPRDGDRTADESPIYNLLNFTGKAIEAIVEMANGYLEYTLWDPVTGELVAVVPPDVASDHTIPEPHTRNLEPAMSCISCHAGDSQWKGFENDVPKILAAGTDIFGDLSATTDQQKQVQLLAGLYSGPSWFQVGIGPLAVGRLSHNYAVLTTTGKSIDEIAAIMVQNRNAYQFDLVDTWGVAAELGIVGLPPSDGDPATDADQKAAAAVLAEFIAAHPANDGGVAREDAIIAAIKAGIPVSRVSLDTCKHLMYERAYSRGIK